MRTTTTNTNAGMADNGVEPVIRISIAWNVGAFTNYTSREGDGSRRPNVLEFNTVTQSTKKDNISMLSSVSFSLDDYDGTIKTAADTGELEGAKVSVFYHFADHPGDSGLRLFSGELTGAVDWNEGTRILRATARTEIFSNRIGFATEDGQFGVNNDVAIGKIWPTVFGHAAHVPAVLVEREPNTELKYQFTLGDFGDDDLYQIITGTDGYKKLKVKDQRELKSLEASNADGDVIESPSKIYLEDGSGFTKDEVISIEIEGVIFNGTITTAEPNVFNVEEVNAAKYMNVAFAERLEDDPDSDNPRVAWLSDDTQSIENSFLYFKKTGNDNMHFFDEEGNVDDNLIRIAKCVRQLGAKIWLENPIPSKEFVSLQDVDSYVKLDDSNISFEVRGLDLSGITVEITNAFNIAKGLLAKRSIRRDEADEVPYGSLLDHLKDMKWVKNLFFEGQPGAKIRQWDSKADIYICNSVESDSVNGVYGIREVNGKERFMPIPRDYYTIELAKATSSEAQALGAPAIVTTIEFDQPLSTYKDQKWRDDIWVTVNSTLSSNTSTQIDYILTNYTNLTTGLSFASVASSLSGKPSNWALLNERDALPMAESMAWQCGCALLYDDDDVEIKLVQTQPAATDAINESNVVFQTTRVYNTSKNDIFTVLKANYNESYRPRTESDERNGSRTCTYRNNINLYGYIESTFDFFIYNNKESVLDTLNFWGYRFSNVWKRLRATCVHNTLLNECFDGVNVSFSDSKILNGATLRGVIEEATVNMLSNTVGLDIWLPVTQGDVLADDNAWQTVGGTTDNIADNITQYDYDVRLPNLENDVDDWLSRLDALRGNVTERARVTAINVTTDDGLKTTDQIKLNIFGNGDTVAATETDQIAAFLDVSKDAIEGQEVLITRDSMGRIVGAMPPPTSLLYVEIVENHEDYLRCKVIDFGGSDFKNTVGDVVYINVAKPWDLRKDTVDGQTYELYGTDWTIEYTAIDERTLTDTDSNTEDQRVTPPYFIGARIHVAQYGQYLTNLIVDIDSVDTSLDWIDVNNSGRQWALRFEE